MLRRPVASSVSIVETTHRGHLRLVTHGDARARGEHRLVLVCGAFLAAAVYAPFARAVVRALPEGWAVDVYDRRGKGGSTPQPEDYDMDTEVQDVAAVLRRTGARHLLGHSLGGAVALHAVRALAGRGTPGLADPALLPQRLSVYDAAINVEGSLDTAWLTEFEEAVDAGRLGRALDLADRFFGNTPTLSRAPTWASAGVLALVLRTGLSRVGREIIPAGVGELRAALAEEATVSDFASMGPRTLLMAGERSAEYFHATTHRLAAGMRDAAVQMAPKGIHGSIPMVLHDVVSSVAAFHRGHPAPVDATVLRAAAPAAR